MADKDKILDSITNPGQLKDLSDQQLIQLANEIREKIIEVVSANGGHLASNLGVADLTVALHRVFDFTHDRLLWDVGHQCYTHKILTGRCDKFNSLRHAGGLSGFPSPQESPFDLFYTGHAGTAISTAEGLAMADKLMGDESRKTVAVVGDASIVNGLSLEGLNNAALLKRQFLVILNDNEMAIDRTRGGLAEALEKLRMTHAYTDLKHSTDTILKKLPLGGEIRGALKHLREGMRTALHGARVFETLGFNYFGPIDGHNIPELVKVLDRIKDINEPVVLHIHTKKGHGCAYAVEDPCRFHSPAAHEIRDGQAIFAKADRPSWTQCFAKILKQHAKEDKKIVAITAAMPDGTGLADFRESFPDRTIDVGISESHAIAAAAGMAKAGLKPVVAIYSTFMQRAFDQVFHEMALQNLPVVVCMDRAGLVGSDGAVHHGFCDISFMRTLPGMTLLAPATEAELKEAMDFALNKCEGPVAMRYPRDLIPEGIPTQCPPFEPGKSRKMRDGEDITLIAYGTMLEFAMEAAYNLEKDGINAAVINARFVKPLDEDMLREVISTGKPVMTLEDHSVIGGFGSAVLEFAARAGLNASNVHIQGIPDMFIEHDSRSNQLKLAGLDSESIAVTAKKLLNRE